MSAIFEYQRGGRPRSGMITEIASIEIKQVYRVLHFSVKRPERRKEITYRSEESEYFRTRSSVTIIRFPFKVIACSLTSKLLYRNYLEVTQPSAVT